MESTVHIASASPESAEAARLVEALDEDLRARYPGIPFHGLRPEDIGHERLVFLIAHSAGEAIGCGAVRELDAQVGEIKRMFVRPAWRRRGIARMILSELERHARKRGYHRLRLETAGGQPEAIALYRSSAYVRIPAFGEYIGNPASICFEKRLR